MTDDSNITAARLAAAADYVARGWHVLLLHDVHTGKCSCGNPNGKADHDTPEGSGGKHPIGAAWGASAIAERGQLDAALTANPYANIGILTGQLSGIWVLDIDPRHDGHLRLLELEAQHGPLPYTYTVRTGSGGAHYYFAMPDDFTPTNAKGMLPPGIDVRGQGGQVVAPTSVTHAGPYWVAVNAPVAAAPAWLLELIRSRPPREATPDYSGGRHEAGDLPTERLARYAAQVVLRECQRLADAQVGSRGSTAFAVACNLLELCNSPWSGLNPERTRWLYDQAAAAAAAHGGGFDAREAESSWASAQRTVGERGRPVPPEITGGALVDFAGGVPPFPEYAASGDGTSWTSSEVMPEPGSVSSGQNPLPSPLISLSIPATSSPGTPAPANFTDPSAFTPDPVEMLLGELVTLDQLCALPPLEPLIEGYLMMDTAAWMIGPSGHGKSFVEVDMVQSVATGKPWHGHAVRQGLVVVLVAEGARGLGPRAKAWEEHHGATAGRNVLFLPRPVQAAGAEWDVFVRAMARLQPVMITIDTQARVSVGMEENSNKEMGVLVEQIERLRRATGACVLTVHHTGKSGLDGRGASAIKGAAQTELTVTRNGQRVTVKTSKQKDGRELPPLELDMREVEVQISAPVVVGETAGLTLATPGRSETSVVLVEPQPADVGGIFDDELNAAERLILSLMIDVFNQGNGGTKAEVRAQFEPRFGGSTSKAGTLRAFYRGWNALIEKGAMGKVQGTQSYRWIPVDERGER